MTLIERMIWLAQYITFRQRGGMSPRFTKTVSSKVNMRNVGRRKKSGKKKKKLCGTLCGTRGTFVETLYMINCKDFSLERFSKKFKLKLTYWRKWTSSRRKCACCWVVSYFSCDKYDLFLSKTVSSLMIQIMVTVLTIRRTRNVN